MEKLVVPFLGKQITLIDHNGVAYVAMREVVEGIGLDWKAQHRKLTAQADKFSCGHMTTTASDGKRYEMLCMPIRKLNGWLFSINPNKVRADLKEKLIAYQEECFLALWDYWTTGVALRDEIQNRMQEFQRRQADYQQRASAKGRELQACKKEKIELQREFEQIQQLNLFENI